MVINVCNAYVANLSTLFIRLSARGAYMFVCTYTFLDFQGGRLFEVGRLLSFHHFQYYFQYCFIIIVVVVVVVVFFSCLGVSLLEQ